MQSSFPPLRPRWLLLAWLVLNLVQAALSPLDPDETYYWMYAGALDWGYFDHPPAVAVLVGLGRDWLPGSLGLRLGHVLAGTATVAALYRLLGRPTGSPLLLAALLILAQPMLQVYGFIATPDGPLLLFTTLYLLAYRRFLREPTLAAGAVWGLTMAGLMYSKYHGAIVIFFSVLPNLSFLLRRPGAWVAALGGILLFFPHIYWQYANDNPSLRYHFSGRNAPYRLSFTLQYIGNQLLVFSPLLLYHYWRTFTVSRAADSFERGCRWLVLGVLLFFLLFTAKGRTEAHWTAALAVPLVYLVFREATRHPAWQPALRRLCLATAILLLGARLLLIAPREWLPFAKPFDNAPWVEDLRDRAAGLPVIFENTYRLASLYQFYSGGEPGFTLTDVDYRPNQYDLWRGDTTLRGDTVLLAGQANWEMPGTTPFRAGRVSLLLREVPDFQVARLARLRTQSPPPDVLRYGTDAEVTVYARSPVPVKLRAALPVWLYAVLHYSDGSVVFWRLRPLATERLPAGEERRLYRGPLAVPRDAPAGEVSLSFALGYRGMPPLVAQSEPSKVTVRARR
ncbi:ArnT family glycosyltransferase [Lewinella sp. IMCC34183]|uniref:ArnT family glycosyltransferase n=1 Tax=Lewinella sp. IMCC34183 TaxID=2248762 RepID=UPI000E2236AE|nr:glycosyltransferase family 39 protein [Lewinella sp. IMCC34183]